MPKIYFLAIAIALLVSIVGAVATGAGAQAVYIIAMLFSLGAGIIMKLSHKAN